MHGEHAFESEYARVRPALQRFVRARVRDAHAAQDLLQEIHAKAHRNRGRYDPRKPFRAWVFTIARNLCIDHLRRRLRDPLSAVGTTAPVDPPDLDALPSGKADDPQRAAERADLVARVRRELAKLPDRRRAAFEMRIVDGLTYREIGEALGVPLGTVAFWVRETLIALAKRLEGL